MTNAARDGVLVQPISFYEFKLSWLKLAYFLGDLKQTDVLVSFRRCNRFTSFEAYRL